MDKGRYKIVRLIDRVVVGGPTKHVVLLCSLLDHRRFHSLLVTGSAARGESECLDYAAANRVEVKVIAGAAPPRLRCRARSSGNRKS